MYLKALEIQGFKSFPDKTVLTFGEDITAIVGPNGSGKSNISDAILWVMGEQSTRALRGGKMEDVIFGGTEKRRQTGYAEVSLILDNSRHIFDRPETEVMITRRYYRSGESEYYINRASCRLRDINELFMDTGLGREGYSIIGQGKVDAILSQKSADRREIFEEAAGISRYRHRKEEAERKLGHTADNLVRISDKIEELELQVEPLREQAEKAKQYLIFRDELRGLEISVWMEQLDRLHENNRKLLSDYEDAVRARDDASQAQENLYRRSEELSGQMQQQEQQLEALRSELSALDESAAEIEAAIAVLNTQVRNNRENAGHLRQEMDQQGDRERSVSAQIEERKARLSEIETRRAQLSDDRARKEQQLEQLRHSVGMLADELEELRRREQLQNASAGDARALLSALMAAQQELLDRDTALAASIQDAKARLTTAQADTKAKRRALEEAEDERNSAVNVINGYELRLQSRKKKLATASELSMRLTMEENAVSSRIHMLAELEKEYEGYSKAVKTVMQSAQRNMLSGIRGPVAGLLHVEDRYTVAVETALGGAMQNIVVEREEDGKAAISFLKRRDAGRATFLPMDAIRPNSIQESGLQRHSGFVGIAADLISFDAQYKNVFANLLGRVIVAEDMDAAIAIARAYHHRYRIVTLDGQVLNAGGSMTGGSVSRSAGILSRGNELARLRAQIDGVQARLKEANQTKADAQREVDAATYELEVAQNQRHELDAQVLQLRGELGQYEVLLDGLRRSMEASQEEQAALAHRMSRTETDTDAARARITQLEGESEALRIETEGKTAGESALKENQNAISSAISELSVELAALDAEEGALRQAIEELCSLRSGLSLDQDQRREQLIDSAKREEELNALMTDQQQALAQRREQRDQRERAMRAVTQARLQTEAQRTRADRDAREKNEELLKLERVCAQLEQKKTSAVMEEKQLLDKLWDTYELSHSEAEKQRQSLESMQKATRRIAELKRAINALGAVNVGAIDDYKRINERYTYLVEQRADVEQSKAELEGIISKITDQMREIFAEQFELISRSFSETFRELFRGGRASLELEDKDDILNCGIEIKVQPPGKSLKIISLLSGGEKAFVAIALYFSILKVRPTPFVVLDEIEAALDDNNVVRFARYMRGMTDHTQFIVITHRRGTMEESDVLYGVTMQEQGISRILTINLNEVEKQLHIK